MSQRDFGGGGGYVPVGGSPFSNTGSPGGFRRSEAAQALQPLTVQQTLRATQDHTDADWKVDGHEIGQVSLVGQVISILPQTTNCVFTIDDGSGQIEARHWVDPGSQADSGKWNGIEENTYVRVIGALKTFGNKRYVNATHIRPVANIHEVYHHLLDAVYTVFVHERGAPNVANVAAGQSGGGVSAYSAGSHAPAAKDEFSHLPPLQKSIVEYIAAQPPSTTGVNVSSIARAMSSKADAQKLSEALDALMDSGNLFTTVDESHFALAM